MELPQAHLGKFGVLLFVLMLVVAIAPVPEPVAAADGDVFLPFVVNQPEAGAVVVVSSNAFRPFASSTSVWVVGELENQTGASVEFVRVTATLRDAGGTVTGTEYSYANVDIIAPGEMSPFDVIVSDVAAWSSVELAVEWSTTTDPVYVLETVSSTASFDSFYAFILTGQARNPHAQAVSEAEAVVTVYDSAGKVIGVDSVDIDPPTLAAGATGSFELEVYFYMGRPDTTQIASHRLQLLGQ